MAAMLRVFPIEELRELSLSAYSFFEHKRITKARERPTHLG